MSPADRRAARLWALVLVLASGLGIWAHLAGALDGEATLVPYLSAVAGIVALVALRPGTRKAPRP